MASIITATTTSGLTQSADNSGVLQLASGTGNLVTIPSVTGTAMVSGNMPTFYAWKSGGNQSISSGTWTTITLETEVWDTASCFASNKFTPNVAGYYQINGAISFTGSGMAGNRAIVSFWKNGGEYSRCQDMSMTNLYAIQGSALIYCNGTTDYIEMRTYLGTSGTINSGSQSDTYMNGFLARSA
jgi:hypothetical protein